MDEADSSDEESNQVSGDGESADKDGDGDEGDEKENADEEAKPDPSPLPQKRSRKPLYGGERINDCSCQSYLPGTFLPFIQLVHCHIQVILSCLLLQSISFIYVRAQITHSASWMCVSDDILCHTYSAYG